MTEQPNELPKGLISFAYNAIFNPSTNESARLDLMGEMSKFGLSEEAQNLILQGQMGGFPDQESKERFIALLRQELMAKIKDLQQ